MMTIQNRSQNTSLAHVAGCEIHYGRLGGGAELVFLHGSGGFRFDSGSFGRLAREYSLTIPSMPGFDGSTIGPVASGQDVAGVMAAFIRTVCGGQAHVAGESFGGRIAAWLAILHPDVVKTAILAAPGGLRRSGGDRGLDLSPEERHLRLFGRKPEGQATADEEARHRANVENAIRLGGPPWDEDLYQQLPSVTRPVLLLYGTKDQTMPRETIDLFHQRIPGSQIRYVEGAPHVISATYPDDFFGAVKDFIDARNATASGDR